MALMSDSVRQEVQAFLQRMDRPVTIRLYPHPGDPASDAMEQLLGELSEMTPRLTVAKETRPAVPIPPETAADLTSSVAVLEVEGQPTGVRYLGFPGGHEFGAFLEDLVLVSTGAPAQLGPAAKQYVEALTEPIHIEVFVTPT
jgi:alkyl hydroperoxide reductase subunit AhpF